MHYLIIGGVAGGSTAAAKLRRISESAQITIIERGPYVSYANCGLPYFISRDITCRSKLLLQTPEGFKSRYNVDVFVNTEALEIDRAQKRVLVAGPEGKRWISYDKLLLAQGGNPLVPPIPGVAQSHVFKLWNVPDMDRIDEFIKTNRPRTALVVGGGFIGIEMAEAFHTRGLETTIVDAAPHVMIHMDKEFGHMMESILKQHHIRIMTSAGVKSIGDGFVVLNDGSTISADLVLLSIGVRPELSLAKAAGLETGNAGGLIVNTFLQTTDPDIFAAGDMTEVHHLVSGKTVRIPLAGPANRQGRIAAANMTGDKLSYSGAMGTSAVKVMTHTAGATGLTEKAARDAGFDVQSVTIHKDHHAAYYPGARLLTLKLIYEKKSLRILGAQAFGEEGVDKRIDVIATAIAGNLTVSDLAELDLSYAPPYSSPNDPVNIAAFVAENADSGFSPVVTANDLENLLHEDDALLIDVRSRQEFDLSHHERAHNIPVDDLRARMDEIPAGKKIYVHCKVGYRGHLALRMLKENGFENVWNVTGGYLSMQFASKPQALEMA